MRVALVIFGDLDQPSGGYLYDQRLVRSLRAAGHRVTVVSQPPDLTYRRQRRLGRRTLRAVRAGGSVSAEHRGTDDLATIARLTEVRPDLVIIDELNHAAVGPWLSALASVLPGVHVTGLVHHLRSDEAGAPRRSRRWEREFLRGCDSFLCNSSVTLGRVQRVSGVRRPSAVAFPGGDSAGYGRGDGTPSPRPSSPSGPRLTPAGTIGSSSTAARRNSLRLLSVGSVIPRKNFHTVVDAVASMPEVHLSIVGDTNVDTRYTELLREKISRHRISDRVVLRGRVPVDLLESEFENADLFAVPSQYEGFGIVFLEALSRGIPVIAPAAGGARDIVRPRTDGYLVRPGSVRQVRRAISEILDHPETLTAMSRAARQRSEQFHSWERSMAGAVRFLETVAAAPVSDGGRGAFRSV
ncbi:MAG: glycosyltransferase family 4 protein [Alkalispirochaeta sp.]